MGRPEKPVDRTVPALASLAVFLRERRNTAGLTYQQLARGSDMPSKATLERAASGVSVPSWATVDAFIYATATTSELFTGNDNVSSALARGRELWIRARRATRAPYYVHTAPNPALISSMSDLSRALRNQHTWAGCPSPGGMERSFPYHLPRSTTRRIINGTTLPSSPQQMIAFLEACYVTSAASLLPWFKAVIQVFERTGQDTARWIEAFDELVEDALAERMQEEEFPPPLLSAA
ncbi:helix-turn-helix domain-containing protein [Streptomyces niveus]|uniref:helix-turn-helix domain-containing protein n=1 Tax=Streptomyces niveus TaxID=193462 RepID=UPI00368CB36A